MHEHPNILVVDDEPAVRALVARMLSDAGYGILQADGAVEAVKQVDAWDVALVLCDVLMPGDASGLELIEALRAKRPSMPVVLMTGAADEAHMRAALDRGAAGFITKPFTAAQLRERVDAAVLRSRRSESELRDRLVAPSVASVLANAIEARDSDIYGHAERLASLALEIGRRCGLEKIELEALRTGAVLHDVGKIGIPDSILLKPGPLTAEERACVVRHVEIGDQMLAPLGLLKAARLVIRHHHERWDGAGYPDGLAGERIPRLARIVAVADSIEAMAARRCYREPRTREELIAELRAGRARQWDPELVDLALEMIDAGVLRIDREGIHVLSDGWLPQIRGARADEPWCDDAPAMA